MSGFLEIIYNRQMDKLHVSIVGGSGYTGSELLRLLVNHPHIEIDQITSRQDDGKNVTDIFPFMPSIKIFLFTLTM